MKKRIIRIGLDFDGVLAYNPFRIIRAPISFFKRRLLSVRKLNFYHPESSFEKIIWIILHESSVFPSRGAVNLKKLANTDNFELHLITARYSFLADNLHRWLKRHKFRNLFTTINLNKNDEQPHLFKEKMVRKYSLDYYIEDNLDIVLHLEKNTEAKIYWIYNIFDKRHIYPYKYPYLGKALENIVQRSKVKAQSLVQS